MALPETFTQFARTAAEQLRWKKARPLVEDELLTHLCDQRDALMAGGMDETVATAESLRLTGDPYEIGTELDRVHRPKTPKFLFALAALIALAGLAFTALVSFRDYELSYFAVHQSVALLLGTAAMLAAYYSKGCRSAQVPIDITLRRYIKKPGGTPAGFVTYTHQRTLYITPSEAEVKKIQLVSE